MFRWLTDRLPPAKRRAKAQAEWEAYREARTAAVRELIRLGWREWISSPPFGYPGRFETVRLEEFMVGAWKRDVMRYEDAHPAWNVADVWWRPVPLALDA